MCGARRTREGIKRNGSEWWNEEIGRVYEKKIFLGMVEDKKRGISGGV